MLDDSEKRYLLDVVDTLNIKPNKKAELYEHIRKFTIQHRQSRRLPFYTGDTTTDTSELE